MRRGGGARAVRRGGGARAVRRGEAAGDGYVQGAGRSGRFGRGLKGQALHQHCIHARGDEACGGLTLVARGGQIQHVHVARCFPRVAVQRLRKGERGRARARVCLLPLSLALAGSPLRGRGGLRLAGVSVLRLLIGGTTWARRRDGFSLRRGISRIMQMESSKR